MGDSFETWSLISRVAGCGVSLVFLVVAVVAAVAASRIKRSRGAWIATVALFGVTFVALVGDALSFAEDSFGSSPWVWLGWYLLDFVFMIALLVGLALIRPTPAPGESAP